MGSLGSLRDVAGLCVLLALSCLTLRGADFAAVYNLKTYGAAGTGQTLDTAAIQKAIDAAAAHGGGLVYFPAGRFLSGTLVLRSNITLYLSPGAVLLGSKRIEDYKPKHLLYADNVSNVAIEGGGVIDGQGDSFLDKDLKPLPRPSPLIEIWNSRGIRIEDVSIRMAPAWTIHPKNCDDVKIRGVSILNNLRGINTDGIDIDSSRNVMISDCHIEAGDDCIVLKTTNRIAAPATDGSPAGTPIVAGSTENVAVTNNVLVSAASALKLGTESYGDFRHIVFSNCVIRDSRTGIALLAKDGGVMEDVRFENILMTTQPKWARGVEWPIEVDIDKRTVQSRLSHIRDIGFSDITVYTKGRILVEGTEESPVENVTFRNVLLRINGYENIDRVKNMSGASKTSSTGMPDYGATPAAMIFAYVSGLRLEGITAVWPNQTNAPARSLVFGDHLEHGLLTGVQGAASAPNVPAIRIENSTDIRQ
ncbi:MAG: right-handed parallel beta-helix repeat-containing protein [Acidobacteriaceae bacterium]|nr:right-handed parallel beta-helix repeat-containing protein [Acidobacteriaceae bacterium]